MDNRKVFLISGPKLSVVRGKSLLSQERLAAASGMSLSNISRIERAGVSSIFTGKVPPLAKALGLSDVDFMVQVAATPEEIVAEGKRRKLARGESDETTEELDAKALGVIRAEARRRGISMNDLVMEAFAQTGAVPNTPVGRTTVTSPPTKQTGEAAKDDSPPLPTTSPEPAAETKQEARPRESGKKQPRQGASRGTAPRT